MKLRILVLLSVLLAPEGRLGGSKPYIVKLRKAHDTNANATEKTTNHGSGHFIADIEIGTPAQRLSVSFKTTTDLIVIPNSRCDSDACRKHHSYAAALSKSSIDIQRDGIPVDPAGGPRAPQGVNRDTVRIGYHASHGKNADIAGEFVRDKLCLGDLLGNTLEKPLPLCRTVDLVAATKEQVEGEDDVFGSRPEDGAIGLSPKLETSLERDFSFLQDVSQAGLRSQFGFFVEDDASAAELAFGGFDQKRADTSLVWAPTAVPEEGYWMVNIMNVQVGSKKLPSLCTPSSPCGAILDISVPSVRMPQDDSKILLEELQAGRSKTEGCFMPDITLELAGGVSLTLAAEDYAGPACEPAVGAHFLTDKPGGLKLFIIGEPLFRRYYTVFDWKSLKVGFARSMGERNCLRLQQAGFPVEQFKCVWPQKKGEEL